MEKLQTIHVFIYAQVKKKSGTAGKIELGRYWFLFFGWETNEFVEEDMALSFE